MADELVPRDDLEATIAARRELGEELEPAVIDAFVERIERRLETRGSERERELKARYQHQKEILAIVLGVSIPLLAIAAIFTGLPGVVAVCAALAVASIAGSR